MIAPLQAVRGAYGALLATRPALVARRVGVGPLDHRASAIARILGARQLIQTLASGRSPTYPVLALGVEVDLLHSGSMLALGILDRRREALTDAAIAGSFAIGGVLAARRAARRPRDPDPPSGPRRWRERWAHRLAAMLVPGFPPRAGGTTGKEALHARPHHRASTESTTREREL